MQERHLDNWYDDWHGTGWDTGCSGYTITQQAYERGDILVILSPMSEGSLKEVQRRPRSLWSDQCMHACSVVSDSLWSHGLYPAKLLCPWDSPGKNTGEDCHFLFRRIFLAQVLTLRLLHWQADSLSLSHLGSLKWLISSLSCLTPERLL